MKYIIFVVLIGFFASVYAAPQLENSEDLGLELIKALNFRNDEAEAKRLIERGANVNYKYDHGWNPLHVCARRGYVETARLLIDKGVNVNDKNEYIDTPMHLAAIGDHAEVIKLLVEYGNAKMNERNKWGETPLHNAAKSGSGRAVKYLLEARAIQMKNKVGKEPRDLALARGYPKIVELLDNAAARYRNIWRACQTYSTEQPKDFILNGSLAKPEEFPWMAALGYLNPNYGVNFKCGGTIISDQFILTAAHCSLKDPPLVVIRLGKINLSDRGAQDYYIEEMIKHPNYSAVTKKNDIALIKLTKRIEFGPNIRPACLEMELRDKHDSVELNVTGWGTTEAEVNTGSNELRKAQVTTISLSDCNATYYEYNLEANHDALENGLVSGQYCARDPTGRRDSCLGDSGGPLQFYPKDSYTARVVGVVSFGVSCGALPGIYTRVAHYLEWIQSHVWPNS